MRVLRMVMGLLLCAAAACNTPEPAVNRSAIKTAAPRGPGDSIIEFTGAGASFPYPLYARWFNSYGEQSNVRINYRAIGSTAGIAELTARTADFGGSDLPLSDGDALSARTRIVHIPTAVGAVAITYNLPEVKRPLRLTGEVTAAIFLGRITRWRDSQITALNPTVSLPDLPITVVHRSDGSGTSQILSQYLASASSEWASGPARQPDIVWPVGETGDGNAGVAGRVKQTEGALGYLEVVYARQNRLSIAHLRNAAGRFVSPLPFEVATAAADVLERRPRTSEALTGAEFRVSLLNSTAPAAYPMASFTWLLIPVDVLGPVRTGVLLDFVEWALTDAREITEAMGYVALPSVVSDRVLESLRTLRPPAP
ncbi:phosphate ABC transporter substrate-binding protein PstS [Gemmatimonas sp.]|uniref:phosphate ABC transporter substrate-binding protein PstS n=1 Tax=Gemmatimonas sp. TaxID=1962908 RepID=UPI003DA4F33C